MGTKIVKKTKIKFINLLLVLLVLAGLFFGVKLILEEPINNAEPAAAASADPLIVQDPEAAPDSSNPDTGTFTEIGIIIALLTLLLIVINLKKKSETEFKI